MPLAAIAAIDAAADTDGIVKVAVGFLENPIQATWETAKPYLPQAAQDKVQGWAADVVKSEAGNYLKNNPAVQMGLLGAGVGGLYGLGSGLLNRKRKSRAFGDALSGMALGGLAGAGGMLAHNYATGTGMFAKDTDTNTDDPKPPPNKVIQGASKGYEMATPFGGATTLGLGGLGAAFGAVKPVLARAAGAFGPNKIHDMLDPNSLRNTLRRVAGTSSGVDLLNTPNALLQPLGNAAREAAGTAARAAPSAEAMKRYLATNAEEAATLLMRGGTPDPKMVEAIRALARADDRIVSNVLSSDPYASVLEKVRETAATEAAKAVTPEAANQHVLSDVNAAAKRVMGEHVRSNPTLFPPRPGWLGGGTANANLAAGDALLRGSTSMTAGAKPTGGLTPVKTRGIMGRTGLGALYGSLLPFGYSLGAETSGVLDAPAGYIGSRFPSYFADR